MRTSNWIFNGGLVIAVAAMLFFLLTEHTAHFFGALPYLFLLACPFMHLFMHRGHHSNKHEKKGSTLAEGPSNHDHVAH